MYFTNLTRNVEIGANCYCLDAGGKKIVLDSGLHPRKEGEESLPNLGLLEDDTVEAIILSHAHHDHLGSLPVLMRHQPRALVFMTEPTRQLAGVMMHNSVNVMLRKREELGLQNYPLFTHREVDTVVKRWVPCPLQQQFTITGDRAAGDGGEITFEFFDAGHIMGSAGVLIRCEGKTIFYTGDVNFEDQTIARAARFPAGPVDVLITETTRGDRPTPAGFTRDEEEMRLARALAREMRRGAAILLPVFALGKTQELLAMIHEFRKKGMVPVVPVYIGGLSTKLTEIYDKLAHVTPRQLPGFQLLDTVAPFVLAGRAAGETPIGKQRIYALSSGMMTEHTLSNSFGRRFLSDSSQALFFVGYTDPESPGGKIKAAGPGGTVVLDPQYPAQKVECLIEEFNFSAHASRESIREYIRTSRPRKVILVHGDLPAIEWFRGAVTEDLPGSEVVTPTPGTRIEL